MARQGEKALKKRGGGASERAKLDVELGAKTRGCDEAVVEAKKTCGPIPAACVAECKAATSVAGGNLSAADIKSLVDLHNKVRADVGVGPVTWSAKVATYAQKWADFLKAKKGCQLQHRSKRDGTRKKPYGENLAGWSLGRGVGIAVKMWADEKKLYKPGTVLTPKNWYPAGHYTQMVWRTSTKIGCGFAVCGNKGVIACNYSPSGNFMGQKPIEPGRPRQW